MNLSPAFFIISAAREHLYVAEIRARTDTLQRQLRGIGYATAECRGHYGGYAEPCILVIDESPGDAACFTDILRLARIYRQDTILAVDCNRMAQLIDTENNAREILGVFTCVSKREAENAGDFTERDGRFYTCIPVST